jgi:hypothetical protein
MPRRVTTSSKRHKTCRDDSDLLLLDDCYALHGGCRMRALSLALCPSFAASIGKTNCLLWNGTLSWECAAILPKVAD